MTRAWIILGQTATTSDTGAAYFFLFAQRAFAALRAMADRCFGVSFAALALPPLEHPSEPRVFAAMLARARMGFTVVCVYALVNLRFGSVQL